jgi:hypothetical protein
MRKQNTIQDFWNKVDKTSNLNGCWIWTDALDRDGYGRFRFNKKNYGPHRFSKLLAGEDPKGLQVCHHCDNPSCVRPDHLFLGTAKDNKVDCINKKRHSYGEKSGTAKLTEQEVIAIRYEYSLGNTSLRKIAIKYSMNHTVIDDIIKRKQWKHI